MDFINETGEVNTINDEYSYISAKRAEKKRARLEKKLNKLDSKTGKTPDDKTNADEGKGSGIGTGTTTDTNTQQGMSSGAKIGLAIGGVVVLGLIIVLATRRS